MSAKMKPWCQFLYLLLVFGQVYVEGVYFCTFTDKIQRFPYDKIRTIQCVTSCCMQDCCPATETETWIWIACAAGSVVLLAVFVMVCAHCRKNETDSSFLAFLKKRAPFSASVTAIQLHNDDFQSHASIPVALASISQTSSSSSSRNTYSYNQNGDHVV